MVAALNFGDSIRLQDYLAERLRQHGAAIFAGDTNTELRRERARVAIAEHGLSAVIVGRGPGGRPMTYSELFTAIWHEPLHVEPRTGDDACT